jgi:hypothetical protein
MADDLVLGSVELRGSDQDEDIPTVQPLADFAGLKSSLP